MKKLILNIISNQLKKKVEECHKELKVLSNLLVEAIECDNLEYQNELKAGIKHYNDIKRLALDLILVFRQSF